MAHEIFIDPDGALGDNAPYHWQSSEIPRITRAFFVFEGERVGVDDGELEAQLVFDGVARAINAIIHEDLAIRRGGADTGHP